MKNKRQQKLHFFFLQLWFNQHNMINQKQVHDEY